MARTTPVSETDLKRNAIVSVHYLIWRPINLTIHCLPKPSTSIDYWSTCISDLLLFSSCFGYALLLTIDHTHSSLPLLCFHMGNQRFPFMKIYPWDKYIARSTTAHILHRWGPHSRKTYIHDLRASEHPYKYWELFSPTLPLLYFSSIGDRLLPSLLYPLSPSRFWVNLAGTKYVWQWP